ncbi:MAG: toprim domain-containing protein, partial [Minisyncoccia bacterium]
MSSQVDFDAFVRWAEDRFDGNVIVKGKNVLLCSIFADDYKHHLSCCPSGGNHKRDWGCYRCYYTENRGTLVGLVMKVDNCSAEEARDILRGQTPIHLLEEELEKFFLGQDQPKVEELPVLPPEGLAFPPYTFPIKDMPEESSERQQAIEYLSERKIPWHGMFYCTDGDYYDRVIIPYYDRDSKVCYWNGRSLGKSRLRYKGPDKSCGIGKGDVLFFWEGWPEDGERIYLTEGEFDAIALCLAGHKGVACGGKSVSDRQVELLRPYKVCLALDGDNAGLHG